MRRQTPIAQLLHNYIFPNPTTNDPATFSAHLARNLVPEVRIEVATFYGDLNSAEARYPGLNYCHAPHRMRLGRFPHHRQLFRAFNNLGLTESEIQDFCCWEGTKWARERYEKDEGVKVFDTTGDEIGPFVDRRELRASDEQRRYSITRKTDISVIVEEAETNLRSVPEPADEDMTDADLEADDADVDTEQESPAETAARQQHIAEVLQRRDASVDHRRINQHIIATWEAGEPLGPHLEQYLKDHAELASILAARRPAQGLVPAVVATPTPRAAA